MLLSHPSRAPPRAVLLCIAVLMLLANSPTFISAQRSSGRAVVPHLGDIVPITLYMRLKRQTTSPFLFGGNDAAGAQLTVDEGDVVEDVEGNVVDVVEEGETAGATTLPEELDLRELNEQLASLIAGKGKHRSQLVRTMPPTYAPRFGINKAVTIMANATLRAAGASLEESTALQQSELAVRFSVGRGLQKESTWLPLASRHKFVSIITELLGNRLAYLGEGGGVGRTADAAAQAEHAELEDAFAAAAEARDHPAVHYLTRVTFYFGYQTGEQQKVTSFAIDARYSPVQRPGIELHYVWDEHRPYNPNRALVLCSAAALLVAMIMTVVVFHPSSRSMLLFSQRIVAVRAHD